MMADPSIPALDRETLCAVLEAVIFTSSEPVHIEEIRNAIEGVDDETLAAAIEQLDQRYAEARSGLRLERVAGGLQFATRSRVGFWVRQFVRQRNRKRLSAAGLETLAIVAYRQPVTAPEIQAIRGKDPTGPLKTLLEKRLVRIMGKKKVVGRPILYGTTREFLVHFGLNGLEDLPAFEEFEQLVGALGELEPEEESPPTDPGSESAGEDET